MNTCEYLEHVKFFINLKRFYTYFTSVDDNSADFSKQNRLERNTVLRKKDYYTISNAFFSVGKSWIL